MVKLNKAKQSILFYKYDRSIVEILRSWKSVKRIELSEIMIDNNMRINNIVSIKLINSYTCK